MFSLKTDDTTLPPLVEPGMNLLLWEEERVAIRNKITGVLGNFPGYPQSTYQILEEITLFGGKVYEIILPSARDETTKALLFVPECAENCPGIVAAHPTSYDFKYCFIKRDCNKNEHYTYAQDLMERGFVVIAPDIFAINNVDETNFSDITKYYSTDSFEKNFPDWTPMGRMFFDHSLCISLLSSLPYVDAKRLGAIGHSLGGHNSLVLAALDERVTAAVSSCGYTSFINNPQVKNAARDEGFCYFPTLREPFRKGETPIDWYEILSLCAPRAFMTWQTTEDIWMPNHEYVIEANRLVRDVYELYGKPERLELHMAEGEHSFPENARELAYSFLESNI